MCVCVRAVPVRRETGSSPVGRGHQSPESEETGIGCDEVIKMCMHFVAIHRDGACIAAISTKTITVTASAEAEIELNAATPQRTECRGAELHL